MEKTYLSEAFKALKILDEDTFDTTSSGIEELRDFLDTDDENDDTLEIIDTEAETEEDLEDSYVDKVILECCVCETPIFKAREEVKLDETGELANVDEECPFCHTVGGYKIKGQVVPFITDEEEVETETNDSEVKVTVDDEDITEGCHGRRHKRIREGGLIGDVNVNATVPVSGNSVGFLGGTSGNVANKAAEEELKESEKEFKNKRTRLCRHCKDTKNEEFEKVEIETDKEKIKIETEPKPEEEVIAPVSDEVKAEIEAENDETEDKAEFEIDDFSEEDFDELGESYLKNIYSNVKGYKTTKASQVANKLKLEGIITFNSGKQKKTNFVFEAKDATKSGKVRFIGENAQICKGRKAFTLTGKINNNKFLSESLNYNYQVKDNNGKARRLYGTVKHK